MGPEHSDVDLEQCEFFWTSSNFDTELLPTPTKETEFHVDEEEMLASKVFNETDMEPTASRDATNASYLLVDVEKLEIIKKSRGNRKKPTNKEALVNPISTAVWFTSIPVAPCRTHTEGANVEKHYTPHSLRTTSIQYLNDEG